MTLDEVKLYKINEYLKMKRDSEEVTPVLYNGHKYDFDDKSYSRITAAIYTLDAGGGTIAWTTADNDIVNITANDLRGIISSAAVRSNELHIKYRQLKERVNNARTVDEVEAIVWDE